MNSGLLLYIAFTELFSLGASSVVALQLLQQQVLQLQQIF